MVGAAVAGAAVAVVCAALLTAQSSLVLFHAATLFIGVIGAANCMTQATYSPAASNPGRRSAPVLDGPLCGFAMRTLSTLLALGSKTGSKAALDVLVQVKASDLNH